MLPRQSTPVLLLRAWLIAWTLACLAGSALGLSPGRFQFTRPVYSTTQEFGVAYITGTDSHLWL